MRADRSWEAEAGPEMRGCLEACRRCEEVVERVVASPPDVARRVYDRVGPHLRHCLDHFVCLLDALERDAVVDYDARARDRTLETEADALAAAVAGVRERLRAIAGLDPTRAVTVRQAGAPGGAEVESPSNLGRELVFLSGHTIHHLAVVRVLCEAGGVAIPESLSMAFSTAAYRAGVESRSP